MRLLSVLTFALVAVVTLPGTIEGQEQEFVNLVKDLLQGDELKTFQNAYASLPLEIRDKLTKDLLSNPGKLGKDLMAMMGPQVQSLLSSFGGALGGGAQPQKRKTSDSNEIDVEEVNMDYSGKTGQSANKQQGQGGLDFGPLGSLLGNMISSNPQMLMNMAQGIFQGGQVNLESITGLLTQQFDLDTVLSMASAFAGPPSKKRNTEGDPSRGEGGGGQAPPPQKGIAELLQLQQVTQMWSEFASSPLGQKVNRLLPRLLKASSLPEALRLIEKETHFRFDVILRQFQDASVRQMYVNQMVRPIGQFFRGLKVPSDLKSVIARADDVLNNKMGLGGSFREYIDPLTSHIRKTFSITKESLLDLSPEDVERIASDILNNEVLLPLNSVYDAYEKAREHSLCAKFIFCQLNHNFYNDNFIKRHVIKTSSIISAFQASAVMKKDAFSGLYEAIHIGADGFDCTHGQSNQCLELMHATAHNEL